MNPQGRVLLSFGLLLGGIIAFNVASSDWGKVLSTIFVIAGLITVVINMFAGE